MTVSYKRERGSGDVGKVAKNKRRARREKFWRFFKKTAKIEREKLEIRVRFRYPEGYGERKRRVDDYFSTGGAFGRNGATDV
jgi:hypothetical protein